MKKRFINKILLTLILLITTQNVSAAELISSCKYKDEEGNILRVSAVDDGNLGYKVNLSTNGADLDYDIDTSDNILQVFSKIASDEAFSSNILGEDIKNDSGEYIVYGLASGLGSTRVFQGMCPQYAVMIRDKQLFAIDVDLYGLADDLEKVRTKVTPKKVYTLEKTEYNYLKYCFYVNLSKDSNGNDENYTPQYLSKEDFTIKSNYDGLNLHEFKFVDNSINDDLELIKHCNEKTKSKNCGLATLKTDMLNSENKIKTAQNGCPLYISTTYSHINTGQSAWREWMKARDSYHSAIIQHDLLQEDPLEPEIPEEKRLICSDIFDAEIIGWIETGMFLIQLTAILIIIVFTIKDYAIVILNSDQDSMKKNNKNLIKRITLLIILLLVPALVKFTFKVFKVEIVDSKDPLCQNVK